MKRGAILLAGLAVSALALPLSAPLLAKVVGQNGEARPLTAAAIASLPAKDQPLWRTYLEASAKQSRADQDALAAELKPGETAPAAPPSANAASTMPLNKDAAWYASAEARRIADNIVSFQTPAGGWGKNQDRTKPVRRPGQPYAVSESGGGWHFVGTIDNGATTTEMRFLARVAAQLPGKEGDAYRASFRRGAAYLLNAQYPNGGWPQAWPLEGGYHDAITFNDNSLVDVAMLMSDIAEAKGDFSFVSEETKEKAAGAVAAALDVILAAQVVINGKKTIWPQQVDMLTLAPVPARAFEPIALSTAESAGLLSFLMRHKNPSPEMKAAVRDGVAWLKAREIMGKAFEGSGEDGRKLVDKPGAGPIWSRYYSIASEQPIFGDRDKTIHDDVNGLSKERRNGYAWFGTQPKSVIAKFDDWAKANP